MIIRAWPIRVLLRDVEEGKSLGHGHVGVATVGERKDHDLAYFNLILQ